MRNQRILIKLSALGLALPLICYILAGVYIWSHQKNFIFMPQRALANIPSDFGLQYEDIFITLKTGEPTRERLHAWWIPAIGGGEWTLLYLHGSAFNIAANIEHARRFQRLGFSVLLLSYRGYGRSDGGFPSETGMYADAGAAWHYLTRDRGRPAGHIYIYGHSLGGAVAIELARNQPDAAGLIVEGTFTSIPELGRHDSRFRLFPIDLIVNQRFDSLSKISQVAVPVLILHGTEDRLVPVSMGRELFDAANPPKSLKLILGGGHNNSARIGGQIYLDTIADFVSNNSRIDLTFLRPVRRIELATSDFMELK